MIDGKDYNWMEADELAHMSEANPNAKREKWEELKKDAAEMFDNNFDCYTTMLTDEGELEEEAMTKTTFLETIEHILHQSSNTVVNGNLFEKEITELAFKKYPIKMVTTGDNPEEWDENEQYRECWIDAYKGFLNK